jgi:hypothetical protein
MNRPSLLLAAGFVLLATLPASADTLLVQRAQLAAKMDLPRRGQSMAAVEAAFGAPATRHAAVGGGSASTPPITRWDYEGFSVYFENGHVVNSVVARASALEIGPAPARP